MDFAKKRKVDTECRAFNINKTKLCFNLTDVHVQSLLRISMSDKQLEFKQLVDNFD